MSNTTDNFIKLISDNKTYAHVTTGTVDTVSGRVAQVILAGDTSAKTPVQVVRDITCYSGDKLVVITENGNYYGIGRL